MVIYSMHACFETGLAKTVFGILGETLGETLPRKSSFRKPVVSILKHEDELQCARNGVTSHARGRSSARVPDVQYHGDLDNHWWRSAAGVSTG